jgi:hypothetical protein
MEIKVTVSKKTRSGIAKESGKPYEMKIVVLTLPNGGEVEVVSNRFNYRTFDYLNDLVEKG